MGVGGKNKNERVRKWGQNNEKRKRPPSNIWDISLYIEKTNIASSILSETTARTKSLYKTESASNKLKRA